MSQCRSEVDAWLPRRVTEFGARTAVAPERRSSGVECHEGAVELGTKCGPPPRYRPVRFPLNFTLALKRPARLQEPKCTLSQNGYGVNVVEINRYL